MQEGEGCRRVWEGMGWCGRLRGCGRVWGMKGEGWCGEGELNLSLN